MSARPKSRTDSTRPAMFTAAHIRGHDVVRCWYCRRSIARALAVDEFGEGSSWACRRCHYGDDPGMSFHGPAETRSRACRAAFRDEVYGLMAEALAGLR